MPTKAIHGITVAHFFETYREKLGLELVTGEAGLHRLIKEGSINRPALALTGFFKYFANKRIQVFGAAEMTFLKTLAQREQIEIFAEMVRRGIPAIVLTRNFIATHPMLAVSQEMNLPIFRTPMITMNFVNIATLCIDNEFAPAGTEHATTLDIKGIGVMIRGDSGIGKSECALALIERGHSLVADDLTVIKLLDERELSASSRPLNRGYMECRGIGIINIADMFGVKASAWRNASTSSSPCAPGRPTSSRSAPASRRITTTSSASRCPTSSFTSAPAATSPGWSRSPPWCRP
jgi:HPr kinase/phosphorylase